MDRKTFLKYSGVLGLGTAICAVKPISESVRFNNKLYKISRTQNMMGTYVTITLMHPSKIEAEEAIGAALVEMERVSRILNRYESNSAIGTLNRDGYLRDLPVEVFNVVKRSKYYHYKSGEAFDITVAPLLSLYREHFERTGSPPSERSILETMEQVDSKAVVLNEKSIRFAREGISITLDGIAKGYVVDRGAEILQGLGIEHGLIEAGGDIRAIGGKNSQSPWRVAVQNPEKERAPMDWIHLSSGAVATSGNYEVYYDSEKLYHHIISPNTGCSPTDVCSVSVKASTVMDADALSTTVFVMGPDEGARFINGLPSTECLILDSDGRKLPSRNWKTA